MTTKQAVLVVTSRQSFVSETERAVSGSSAVKLAGRAALSNGATAPGCVEALRSGEASAILMDLDSDAAECLRALKEICTLAPEARVVVAGTSRDPDLILRAMRDGAADFISIPLDRAALQEALSRAMRRADAAGAPAPRGRVISFLNAKGGCGATTVGVNLAASLCSRKAGGGRSVILLDMDRPGGDATAMLKLEPSYSLADVAANIHRLDMDLLNSMTAHHESGLQCLAAAGQRSKSGASAPMTPEVMTSIVSLLREQFDDVILAGGGMGELDMAAVNLAHMVHVVTTLDFLALRRAQTMIAELREFSVMGDALRVVVNKYDRRGDLTVRDAREALDAPVVWSIPYDAKAAQTAINEGVPFTLKGTGRLQTAFEEYAALLSGPEAASAGGGFGGLLKRLVPGRAGATV